MCITCDKSLNKLNNITRRYSVINYDKLIKLDNESTKRGDSGIGGEGRARSEEGGKVVTWRSLAN